MTDRAPGSLRTLLVVLGSSWLPLALNILRVLVLPTRLGDQGMGQVTLGISFAGFFGIFTSLGISTYIIRAVARDNSTLDRYMGNALALRVVMGGAVVAVMAGVANLFGYQTETRTVIMILALQMVILTLSNVFEAGLQGLGQQSWRAIATAIGQMVATVVGVSMLLSGADAVAYAWSLPLGTGVQFVIVLAYFFIRRPLHLSVDRGIIRTLFVGSLPLFLWGVLQTAYAQIDATLLSLFAGEHVVGWFGAAAQITNVLVVIPGAIITVALPVLSSQFVRSGEEFDRTASRTLLTTLLVVAPLGAGVAVSAPDILRILPYPVAFLNAVPVLSLLGIAVPVTAVLMVLATLAVAIGQEKQWLKISVFAVCIFPPLYTSLIWLFQTRIGNGAIGAAAANLIGETALLIWAWIVLPARVKQADVVRQGLQIGALALIMVGAVVALRSFSVHLIIYVPIAAAIYFAGAWALKLVTANDVQVVRNALARRGRAQAATL